MPDRGVQRVDAREVAESPNQRWWREHGADWPAEVQRRKATMPAYHLQEAYFSYYFSACAPARVLEFGCGFGRHLRYLDEIEGLDVYGCDQSPAMLAAIGVEAPGKDLRGRVCVVPSAGPLPYPDGAFDVVFTNAVLIHNRPEHVPGVLAELIRVCRGHVLHLENQPARETRLTSAEHDGCWAHPIVELYAGLGVHAEILPSPNAIQGCYRAVVNPSRTLPTVMPGMAAAFQRLDRALSDTIAQLQGGLATAQSALQQAAAEAEECRAEIAALRRQWERSVEELREARECLAELRGVCDRSERRWQAFLRRLNAALSTSAGTGG